MINIRKISNVGLAQLVFNELDGAVSFSDILGDIDADRTPAEEDHIVSDAWVSDITHRIVNGWIETIECDAILDEINGRI